jgi:hypothetical protein
MRARAGLVLALFLSSFVFAAHPAAAQAPSGSRLDRGLTSIESGQPVPLSNRPRPARGRGLDRETGRAASSPRA